MRHLFPRRPLAMVAIVAAATAFVVAQTPPPAAPQNAAGTGANATDPDAKAYTAAMQAPNGQERVAALTKFLKDFPESTYKERARFAQAQAYPTAADRAAALSRFLEDFPESAQREQASFALAQTAVAPADRAAALRKFVADFPSSTSKDRAEYMITMTVPAAEREAAQEQFAKDHPKSAYTSQIYQSRFMTDVGAKPVDLEKLKGDIDRVLSAAPADVATPSGKYTFNARSSSLNTIADRLMANDVLLDRALEVIAEAVKCAGETENPESRGMYTTTLGEVQFKLGRYDDAGETLVKAIAISGGDGDAEAQLFLGKYHEKKGDEASALTAYLKAYELGSPYDSKDSAYRLYARAHGSTAGLEADLDRKYLTASKPFDPGKYARPAAAKGAPRVVVAELFTGAECNPCIGADWAFDGLADRYGRNDVAVLVYHLHIPGPDPMTNTDTEARGGYYRIGGTPTVIIDGAEVSGGGGSKASSGNLFNGYKTRIDARFEVAPLATLSGFKATMTGAKIGVTGTASLASAAAGKVAGAKLRVAIVEDSVRYVGSNGVRFHEFVVRKLMGSPDGVAVTAAAPVVFNQSVDLSVVSASLDTYLSGYEQVRSARAPFKFSERVDQLDAKRMRVVAFVQDDSTREILQAVVVMPGK